MISLDIAKTKGLFHLNTFFCHLINKMYSNFYTKPDFGHLFSLGAEM